MASFPVAPRYAKMLCLSNQYDLWPYTIALVAALTVQEVLIEMPLDSSGDTFGEAWYEPYTIAVVSALTVQEVLIEIPLDSTEDTFFS